MPDAKRTSEADERDMVRAYHPPSGSVLVAEVVGNSRDGSLRVVPEGTADPVVLRTGVWSWTFL